VIELHAISHDEEGRTAGYRIGGDQSAGRPAMSQPARLLAGVVGVPKPTTPNSAGAGHVKLQGPSGLRACMLACASPTKGNGRLIFGRIVRWTLGRPQAFTESQMCITRLPYWRPSRRSH
jgi:hypothetical protein